MLERALEWLNECIPFAGEAFCYPLFEWWLAAFNAWQGR